MQSLTRHALVVIGHGQVHNLGVRHYAPDHLFVLECPPTQRVSTCARGMGT